MTTRVYTDRSRIEDEQRCPRRRFLAYHEGPTGMGISSRKKPLPLAVGGSAHVGFAVLLREGQRTLNFRDAAFSGLKGAITPEMLESKSSLSEIEDAAVKVALADFEQFANGQLELDTTETDEMDLTAFDEGEKVKVKSAIDQYLFDEQCALVEAMVRAYARRRLRPLLEQYEVLEVEREGEWLLGEFHSKNYSPNLCPRCQVGKDTDGDGNCSYCARMSDESAAIIRGEREAAELWFMSRHDALLRDRQTNDLYIQSFKTAASWDVRKARDAEHDMQGLSEGVEVEKRLAEWWHLVQEHMKINKGMWNVTDLHVGGTTIPMKTAIYLRNLTSSPRILGIRYEYIFKGDRWRDKDLTAQLGVEARTQRTHLVRGYLNAGMTAGDEQWNWSWDYVKDTGEPSKLYWKAWKGAAVWEHMPIAQWIDMLDATAETVGEEGASKGWSGPAQTSGFTVDHPLDAVFHPPLIVYRNDDELRDWIEQVESQERRVVEGVAKVRAASDEGERRSLLNQYFPQSRHACTYPTVCQFCNTPYRAGVCYAGEHVQRNPLATGDYVVRVPNHPQEVERENG